MEPKEIILSEDIKRNEEPRNLIERLRDSVEEFSKRETLGSIKTEHVVFIPSKSLEEDAVDTTQFILLAREIRKNPEYGCPVSVEQMNTGGHGGLLFVFEFSQFTKFANLVSLIETKLPTTN
ncbi:hypothetical protein [Bacillus phage SWEP1]|nr:hypothetical protein [Bacillus phage SWEP1]